LTAINESPELREKFIELTDYADVVLACRVSPKQKADIVNLIKKRYPKKITLAIGDGANDVNMILQAHVGVGLLGKEGQQAARSADFAIGQFKFLKPLMFIHGREAYRRNSFLVLYTFYKNILYISPQYVFGFYSYFSAQVLYEPFIYQLYNITFTSIPIMFYALFDFEFEKFSWDRQETGKKVTKYFMTHPDLYDIGLKYSKFSFGLFAQWLLYGLFHATLVFYLTFYFMNANDI
jgi:phospholipid-transporting ATPase